MPFEQLFSPIKLGTLGIKNRIVMAPMGTNLAHPVRLWADEEIAYFVERARGGVGLIISPFTAGTRVLSDTLHGRPLMAINDDSQIPSHRRMTDAVHEAGASMFCQVATFGGKFGEAAPSAITSPNYTTRPRALALEEIWAIIDDFGQAGRRAREAGYDGVEIHGCHGYLIGQFISPALNRRSDEFGGSFDRRMRFPLEVFRAMRREAGQDFPLGFKFSAWEDVAGGIQGGEEAARVARRMAHEGVCYVHVGTLNTTVERLSPYPSVPCNYVPRNTLMPLAREIRAAVPDTPIVATGSIILPQEAERFLADGVCDMVALGRTLLADPHWPAKARDAKRIRPCIRCNVCHHQLWLGRPLICQVNPYLLKERQEPVQPAARSKRVLVAGAGPGGITAALAAAARGHDVTLCEARPYVGGMLHPGSRPACKDELRLLLDYCRAELADSDVKVKTGVSVTLETVRQQKPDALVIAVGSRAAVPDVPGIDGPHVLTAVDALRDADAVSGRRVLVVGGGDVGCETACFLVDAGKTVTIVEILPELAAGQDIRNVRMLLYKLLDDKGVRCLTCTTLTQIDRSSVEVTGPNGSRTLAADTVVLATGRESSEELRDTLRLGCAEVHVVGDCGTPGRIRDAVAQGDLAGRLI